MAGRRLSGLAPPPGSVMRSGRAISLHSPVSHLRRLGFGQQPPIFLATTREETNMVRLLLAGCLASLAVTALLAGTPQQGPFQLSCTTLPFETIKKDRDIDDVCNRAGTASTDPQREQNRAKNQFCASGPAALATEFSFTRLQAAAEDAGVTGCPRIARS